MADDNGKEKKEQGMDIFSPPRLPLKCGKCGSEFSIHMPIIDIRTQLNVTVIVISPSWGLNERICRGCGTAYAPSIANVPQITWVEVQKPKGSEPSRIITDVGGPVLPPDFDFRKG